MNKLEIKKMMEEKCGKCVANILCEAEHQYRCVSEDFCYYIEPEENKEKDFDMLEEIFFTQKQLQENTMGYKFEEMNLKDKANYIREMMLWTTDELHEALHELSYAKTWSKRYDKPEYDHKKQNRLFKEEMIDALHFFMNIMIAAGFTPQEIYDMYMEKNKENIDRQKRGY